MHCPGQVMPDLVKFMDSIQAKVMQAHAMTSKIETDAGGIKVMEQQTNECGPYISDCFLGTFHSNLL